MRVLLITDYGYLAGGAELMMLRFRDELQARGHDARLFSTGIAGAGQPNQADYTCHGTESGFRTLLQTSNPWAARALGRVLREFRPDIVHVRMFLTQLSPLILPALESIPSIFHVAWYRPVCPTGTKMLPGGEACSQNWGRACLANGCLPLRDWAPLMLQMRLFHHWQRNFDRIVANSNAVSLRLEEGGLGPVEVVYNGIPAAPRPGRRNKEPVVSFVGRLVAEKGVSVLLDAFERVVQRLPEARLLIAGDGPERERLEQRAKAIGVHRNTRFLGQVPHDSQAKVLASARIHAVPSLWAEPFGIVAVEAMSRGQAVVASDHGGLSEIVLPGETGLLVPPGNAAALAQALLVLLEDPVQAQAQGDAAYRRATDYFSLDSFTDRFITLYRDLRQNRR